MCLSQEHVMHALRVDFLLFLCFCLREKTGDTIFLILGVMVQVVLHSQNWRIVVTDWDGFYVSWWVWWKRMGIHEVKGSDGITSKNHHSCCGIPWGNVLLVAEWLEQASQWYEMCCHDLEVMSSNPSWVELGARSTSVLSRTWSKNVSILVIRVEVESMWRLNSYRIQMIMAAHGCSIVMFERINKQIFYFL